MYILYIVILHLMSSAISSEDSINLLRSVRFRAEDKEAISGAKLISDKSVSVTNISICVRFFYKKEMQLVTIGDWVPDGQIARNLFTLIILKAGYPLTFFEFGYPVAKGSFKSWVIRDPENPDYSWSFNRWCHACLSYEQNNGYFKLIMDGKVTNIDSADAEYTKVKIPTNFLSKVYLGKCNFNADWCHSPEGHQIADFNIWSRALTHQEMKDWTTCRSMLKGDIVDWDTAKFELENMTMEIQPTSYLCIPPSPGHVLFPEKRNFETHGIFCQKMRGMFSVIEDNVTQTWMSTQLLNHTKACGVDYWGGWWDIPREGHYSNVNTGVELTPGKFAPWNLGEPNGDTLENCAATNARVNEWWDNNCVRQEFCSFCKLDTYPILQIRGLCLDTSFDKMFSWTNSMVNDRYSFKGYAVSLLYFMPNVTRWKLEHIYAPQNYATVNVTEYPLGTLTWNIYGDCYGFNGTEVALNINACKSSEFNCIDGQCVSMNQRCDRRVDCVDKSDELNCEIFTTDVSYLRDVPPASVEGGDEKVNIAIDILSILDISEVGNTITLQLWLQLTWLDQRLTMFNLKEDTDLNTLTANFKNRIWIPELVFFNTQDKLETLNDEKGFITITRQGKYLMSTRDKLHNYYIFKGSENPLSISRVYNAEFICQFNMATFPFDTQVCSIILTLKGNSERFVDMAVAKLRYLGPIDLTQYFVKNTTMFEYVVYPNISAIKVDIVFGRRILGTMLTTFLPTILICLVSFSTNYYKTYFFEANVSVNLTCLLVLTTLFISESSSMTKTAYIKMIDVWFVFNLCIPFAEVILHTFIDRLRDSEEEDTKDTNRYGATIAKEISKSHSEQQVGEDKVVLKINHVTKRMKGNLDDKIKAVKRGRNNMKLKITMKIVDTGLPTSFVLFIVGYFGVGSYYYNYGV